MHAKILIKKRKEIQGECRHNRGTALRLLSLLLRDPSPVWAITISDSAETACYPVIINNSGFFWKELSEVPGGLFWGAWAVICASLLKPGMFGVCVCVCKCSLRFEYQNKRSDWVHNRVSLRSVKLTCDVFICFGSNFLHQSKKKKNGLKPKRETRMGQDVWMHIRGLSTFHAK